MNTNTLDIISQKIQLYQMLLKYSIGRRKSQIESVLRSLRVIENNLQATTTDKEGFALEKIHLDRIKTDTKLFQNRKQEYSERSVNNIVEAVKNGTFVWQNFDPITLWLNGDYYYILSGHSRYEAFRRLVAMGYKQFQYIPAKIFSGSLKEAQQIAKKSNTLATKETAIERARYYQDLRSEGVDEKEIIAEAKQNEDKNASYILALSHLNLDGQLVQDLEMFQTEDNENSETLKKIANWIGSVRGMYRFLSDQHETEMYRYLTKNNRHKNYTKASFLAEIQKVIARREMFNEGYNAPLNLESFVSKTQIEQSYDENLREAKQRLKEAIENRQIKMQQLLKSLQQQEKGIDQKGLDRVQQILFEQGYDAAIRNAEREVLRLENLRSEIKKQAQSELTLFGVGIKVGEINTQIAEQAGISKGEIFLNDGNKHFGLKHITERHKTELEQLAMSAEDLVKFVCQNFNEIREDKKKILLIKHNNKDKAVVVELQFNMENEIFYQVITAGVYRKDYLKKKKLLWRQSEPDAADRLLGLSFYQAKQRSLCLTNADT